MASLSETLQATSLFLVADPRTNSVLASKFINCLMRGGKKSVAQNVFYSALEIIREKVPEEDPVSVFTKAVENVRPGIEVRSRRVGGATYQVPTPVNPKRQVTLAIRWILLACRGKKGRPMQFRLAEEFIAAYKREGTAMTTRENVHRMADANKAFAHFAW